MNLIKYLCTQLTMAIVEARKNNYGFDEDELFDIMDKLRGVQSKQELLRSLFNINENNTGKLCYSCKYYVSHTTSPHCKKWMMLVFSAAGNPIPITGTCHRNTMVESQK